MGRMVQHAGWKRSRFLHQARLPHDLPASQGQNFPRRNLLVRGDRDDQEAEHIVLQGGDQVGEGHLDRQSQSHS